MASTLTKIGSKKTMMLSQKNNVLLSVISGLLVLSVFLTSLAFGENIQVDIEGDSYNVEYSGSGVSISGIEADLDFISLILDVNVTGSNSSLDITFDRSFFDSQYEGADESFIILADGDEPNFIETENNSQSRTLSIQIPSGTEEIEIIGSVFGDNSSVQVIDITEQEVEESSTPELPEELGLAPFVDESKDPQSYVDRYNNEPSYKEWFDENYPEYSSIYQAVGLEEPEPIVEEPIVEEPIVEEPIVEEENPRTECGPGTTLKDGVCVLDEKCGPGTILEDGVCVLSVNDPSPTQTDKSIRELGKDLIFGIVAAFVVAGILGIIVALMLKASKRKDD